MVQFLNSQFFIFISRILTTKSMGNPKLSSDSVLPFYHLCRRHSLFHLRSCLHTKQNNPLAKSNCKIYSLSSLEERRSWVSPPGIWQPRYFFILDTAQIEPPILELFLLKFSRFRGSTSFWHYSHSCTVLVVLRIFYLSWIEILLRKKKQGKGRKLDPT